MVKYSPKKEVKEFNGKKYMLENSLTGEYAFVKCYQADKEGNLTFHRTARNFNPDVAMAGKIVIAEADEIVETGSIDPDHIHVPSVFVHRVVKGIKE